MTNNTHTPDIVLITPTLDGGVGVVTSRLATEMHKRGHIVEVWSLSRGAYARKTERSVPVHYLNSNRAVGSIFELIRLMRDRKPRTILSASYHMNCAVLLARMIASIKTRLVIVEHTSLSNGLDTITGLKQWIAKISIRVCYPMADAYIAVSKDVAQQMAQFAGMNTSNVTVIYNPVITPEITSARSTAIDRPLFDTDEPVILAVGRLSPEKDYPTLLHAFAQVNQTHSSQLVILGDGPEREHIEELIEELAIVDRVSLLGHVTNPYPYFLHSDVFVLSSRREGLPTVLIEALALGTPVVSTDARSGPREILHDGAYGTLVPVGDIDALATALVHTLSSPVQDIPTTALTPYTVDAATDAYLHTLFPSM